MPDDHRLLTHVSLRVPSDLIEAFDRLAAALDRPRSWVMLRALRQYLEDGEGAEVAEDIESLAELDRGETVPFEESMRRVREIIAGAEADTADKK
ncbi:MAG TPA: ribbon-helix-helix protein, CopG family [Stellaceae bacterium]|nr:ribbon-helix-helix protein, CopG family [Stellaceae bacterium]